MNVYLSQKSAELFDRMIRAEWEAVIAHNLPEHLIFKGQTPWDRMIARIKKRNNEALDN